MSVKNVYSTLVHHASKVRQSVMTISYAQMSICMMEGGITPAWTETWNIASSPVIISCSVSHDQILRLLGS